MQNASYPQEEIVRLATVFCDQLERYTTHGLPDVYCGNLDEALADLWPELPWDEEAATKAAKWILQHHVATVVLFDDKFDLLNTVSSIYRNIWSMAHVDPLIGAGCLEDHVAETDCPNDLYGVFDESDWGVPIDLFCRMLQPWWDEDRKKHSAPTAK